MKHNHNYIMHEQVENLIPSLMEQECSIKFQPQENHLHLVAVAVVTAVYLVTMALTG